MKKNNSALSPRQDMFIQAYTDPYSQTFSNCYRSAIKAGYSAMTARNLTHLKPAWLSENIGILATVIEPDSLMRELTSIINNDTEPTIVRLKAIEMTMKAYSMMVQRKEQKTEVVTLNVDLTGAVTSFLPTS